jgi:hypothetical protein
MAGKKSNNPEKARKFSESRRSGSRGFHPFTMKHSESAEYRKIMAITLLRYQTGGRQAAIEYLQYMRPWLVQYCGTMPHWPKNEPNREFPASGAILDGLLAQQREL